MTKDEILEYVKSAGLVPNDIVEMSYRMVPVTQAHDWLRTWRFSLSTLLLLRWYAERKLSSAWIFCQEKSIEEKVEEVTGKKLVEIPITTVEELAVVKCDPIPPKSVEIEHGAVQAKMSGSNHDEKEDMTFIRKPNRNCLLATVLGKRWEIPLGTRYFRAIGPRVYDIEDFREIEE